MFCVIYEFEVNPMKENEFKKIWHQLTLLIKEFRGGLGSRLHKDTMKPNIWVGYAQWPSEDVWNNPDPANEENLAQLRDRLRETCIDIRPVYQLDVVDDLLSNP
jgi:heme-degrading monooxygenase HmoA